MIDWSFDAWPAVVPNWHPQASRTDPWDTMDFHVDLGCGTVKKGRIGIDRYPAPGVNVVMNLDIGQVYSHAQAPGEDAPELPYIPSANWGQGFVEPGKGASPRSADGFYIRVREWGLPFEDSSIESIISHHCLEHVGEGFIPLMDDIYRVLKPGGIFRAITPLFPSTAAVSDPDHCRYFMEGTWLSFCGHLGDENNPTGSWLDSFSVPYTKARFHMEDLDCTAVAAPDKRWQAEDAREIRVALRAVKPEDPTC